MISKISGFVNSFLKIFFKNSIFLTHLFSVYIIVISYVERQRLGATILGKLKSMSRSIFLDAFKREYEAGQRFCFILGSGASYTAGIKTGEVLMRQWKQELLDREKEVGGNYIKDCAAAAGYAWEDCRAIFERDDSMLKNEDYFVLYDIRFVGSPTAGYDFLENSMKNLTPNVGYYYLASILENTKNKMVITTNFDSLTEDALFYYSGHHPLVLGHERLASYITNVDNRPVIAKIHRDLLMNPMNHATEMKELQEEWESPLSAVLTRYTPIVIGYAGGDRTLMSLLEKLKLNGIFWCTMGDEPPQKAKTIISKNNGYWVKINGFDQLMYLMADMLDKKPCAKTMKETAVQRLDSYASKDKELHDKYTISSHEKDDSDTPSVSDIDMIHAVNRTETENSEAEAAEAFRLQAVVAWSDKDYETALKHLNEAIKLSPDQAKLYDSRGVILQAQGLYDEALTDKNKAVELEPDNAEFYRSRGITLHTLKHYSEALADKSKAIELGAESAKVYNSRSVTLRALKQYGEALADAEKALALEPNNARYYNSRGKALHMLKRYDEALSDKTRAIELDPKNAKYYKSRAETFRAMGHTDEEKNDINKSKELAS